MQPGLNRNRTTSPVNAYLADVMFRWNTFGKPIHAFTFCTIKFYFYILHSGILAAVTWLSDNVFITKWTRHMDLWMVQGFYLSHSTLFDLRQRVSGRRRAHGPLDVDAISAGANLSRLQRVDSVLILLNFYQFIAWGYSIFSMHSVS